jgi:hypothetical protein
MNILYIIVAWALFIYVGYNVLNAEAAKDCSSISEPDDDFYCKQFDWSSYHPDKQTVDELCDASEDYAKNPKNCNKAYKLVEEKEKEAQNNIEKACDKAGLKLNNKGECDAKGNEDNADKFDKELDKIQQKQKPDDGSSVEKVEDWRNTVTTNDDDNTISSDGLNQRCCNPTLDPEGVKQIEEEAKKLEEDDDDDFKSSEEATEEEEEAMEEGEE